MFSSERTLHALFGSPLYPLSLRGAQAGNVVAFPPDPRLGDPTAGAAVLAGQYPAPGGLRERGSDPWGAPSDEGADAELHGFGWLRDLVALGSEEARKQARALISGWLTQYDRWHPIAWRVDVMAERIARWLAAMPFVAPDEADLQASMLASIARQARHLVRIGGRTAEGPYGLTAARGLILVGASVDNQASALTAGLKILMRALSVHILADGGHIKRDPAQHLAAFEELIEIREALSAVGRDVPVPLQNAIERMSPFLRAMRLGDGGFALFNGAKECAAARIDAALSRAGARGKALSSAPHTGYQRMVAGRATIIADVGHPPPPRFDGDAHAAPLAFEMSVGRRRLIVNCGAQPDRTSPWHQALKATAAHSTIALDDSNAFAIGAGGIEDRTVAVTCQRREADGNTVIEARHDGYRARFGVVHRRDLYLSADGTDVRGRDVLDGNAGAHRHVVRFHLHPDVKVSLLEGGASALLKLGDGEGWRLRTGSGHLAVEESVYYGGAEPRRSQQLTIAGGSTESEIEIKWALRREGGG